MELSENSFKPNVLLIFSGKRKAGKDYVCNLLIDILQKNNKEFCITSISISAPLKEEYAKANNLDYEKLMDSSAYKENFRIKMIEWSDSIRSQDPSFFCRKAVDSSIKRLSLVDSKSELFHVWIVRDVRRMTDLDYFMNKYPNRVKTVRVLANEEVRKERDWIYTPGVDDSISECDLDSIKDWDFEIFNNHDTSTMHKQLELIIDYLREAFVSAYFN